MDPNMDIVSTTIEDNNTMQNPDLKRDDVIPTGDIEIILKILEFHNIPTDDTENILNVTFMNKKLEGQGETTFTECPCHPDNIASSIWRMKLSNINEEVIMDLSSHPLLFSISKIGSLDNGSIESNKNQEDGIHTTALAVCCIDIGDLISDEIQLIRSKIQLHPNQAQIGQYNDLHPNLPQITYILTSSKPIIGRRENGVGPPLEISTVTIKTEFIIHPSTFMLQTGNEFDINIMLPLREGESKSICFTQGFPSTLKKLPPFVTRYGLSKLPGDAKYSHIATRKDTDFADLNYPSNINLNVSAEAKVISLNEVCSFKQFTLIVKNLVDRGAIPVEIICKNKSMIHKFAGNIDLKMFNYVDQTRIRQAISLTPVSSRKTTKTDGSKSSKIIKSKIKATGAKKKSKESLTSIETESGIKNMLSDDGSISCLVLEITLDRPLVKLKEEVMSLDDIKMTEKKVFVESGIKMLDRREIDSIFQAEIFRFVTHPRLEKYHELNPMNDIWAIADEDLFGSAALLIANKFNFDESMDEDDMQTMLRKSYVYLLNQAYDMLNANSNNDSLQELINFRLQCAEECRELGYACAKDFHIMNLKDTVSSALNLIDYAVFNFRMGDTEKGLVCALDAQDKNPELFDCYFLEAYAYYKKDKKKCESILQKLTKRCPNFLEAWIVLNLLHIDDLLYPDQKQIEEGMNKAADFPFIGQLHKMESIFWSPGNFGNLLGKAISNFIIWGCVEFAELALANSIKELGANSYEYNIFKALIRYMRGRCIDALHVLSRIQLKCNSRSKGDQVNRLKALCYLNLKSEYVIDLLDVLNVQHPKTYTAQCNLLNLKIGRFLAESGNLKAARCYLKEACQKSGTYASLIEFGNLLMKYSAFDDALACFRMAYKVNPYDWVPWAKMAVIYFRSDLPDQYRFCAKNARENKITDEIASRELDRIDKIING